MPHPPNGLRGSERQRARGPTNAPLNWREGTYEALWQLPSTTKVNAVAMLYGTNVTTGERENYMFGCVGGYLCRFDAATLECFDEPLEYEDANVGGITSKAASPPAGPSSRRRPPPSSSPRTSSPRPPSPLAPSAPLASTAPSPRTTSRSRPSREAPGTTRSPSPRNTSPPTKNAGKRATANSSCSSTDL